MKDGKASFPPLSRMNHINIYRNSYKEYILGLLVLDEGWKSSVNIPDKLLNFIKAVWLNSNITAKWKYLQEKLQRISPVWDHILSKKKCALVLISLEYNSPLYLLFVPSTICMGMQSTEKTQDIFYVTVAVDVYVIHSG